MSIRRSWDPRERAVTVPITQASHGFAVGDVVRSSSGSYAKAQADSAANAEVAGIVSAVLSVDRFELTLEGRVAGLSGLSADSVYFLSDATAGLLTDTEPTATGSISKPLLIAVSTTVGYLFNFRGEIIGAASGGGGETLTLVWEETADTITVSSTSSASPTTLFAGGSVTYDGTSEYEFQFSCAQIQPTSDAVVALYLGGTFQKALTGGTARGPVFGRWRFTPSAGAQTYSVGGYQSSGIFYAYGSTDDFVPMTFRIYKVG